MLRRWTVGWAHAWLTVGSRRAHATVLITEALQQLVQHKWWKLMEKQTSQKVISEDTHGKFVDTHKAPRSDNSITIGRRESKVGAPGAGHSFAFAQGT